MKRVNICLGRFQPFTAGHFKCIEAAWNLKHLPTVICMIGVNESKVDERHPFPSNLLLNVYNELFAGDNRIIDVVSVFSANIVSVGSYLRKLGYEIASWTCGTDRAADYARMSTKYHDQAGLSNDFELIEVPRTDEDISATKARQCLLANDRDGFVRLMPNGSESIFDELKQQIDKVYSVGESYMLSLEDRISKLEKLMLEAASPDEPSYRFRKVISFNDSLIPMALSNYAYHASFGDRDWYYKKYKLTKAELDESGRGLDNLVKAILGSVSKNGEMPNPNAVARALNNSKVGPKLWKVCDRDPSSKSGRVGKDNIVLIYTDTLGNVSYIRCEGPMVKAK